MSHNGKETLIASVRECGRLSRISDLNCDSLTKLSSGKRLLYTNGQSALLYENQIVREVQNGVEIHRYEIKDILHFEIKLGNRIIYRNSTDLKDYAYSIEDGAVSPWVAGFKKLVCWNEMPSGYLANYSESQQVFSPSYIANITHDLTNEMWSHAKLDILNDCTFYQGYVYEIGSHPFTVRAIAAGDGRVLFEKSDFESVLGEEAKNIETNDGIRVHGDTIVACLTQNNILLGIDRHTGEVSWKAEGISGRKYLATEEGLLYTVYRGHLNTIRISDGEVIASVKLQSDRFLPDAHPMARMLSGVEFITSTHIFVNWSMGGELEAYDLKTGEVVFSERLPGCLSKAQVHDGKLYISTAQMDVENAEKAYLVYGPG